MARGQILYSFYGDDFTGSTDALQQLASNGVEAVLFLRQPSAEQLARFPGVQAIGIAGDSRSRSPAWMRENLPDVFAQLKSFGAPVSQYKVCSTFDSGPEVGSIGCAIDIGLEVFTGTPFVPVVVAAPHLRRYVCFGNLFAAAPGGEVVRIDRHPMRRHPVTPMTEADLRTHLGGQTAEAVGLVDLAQWAGNGAPALPSERIVLFDGTDAAMNGRVGELLWQHAQESPLFSAASSGLTAALVHAWHADGILAREAPSVARPAKVSPLLVVSGSCSAATAGQIRWALAHGFSGIAVDPKLLVDSETGDAARERLASEAAGALRAGRSTVLYTAMGAAQTESVFGEPLGAALGQVIAAVLETYDLRRLVLCGGDTCSHAVQQWEVDALTWVADVSPGAPLCRAHSTAPKLDGLELVLKGGQIGEEDMFGRVLRLGA